MLSFTTRVVNGATEIVESDGTWRFADRLEVEMMERIAVRWNFRRPTKTIDECRKAFGAE